MHAASGAGLLERRQAEEPGWLPAQPDGAELQLLLRRRGDQLGAVGGVLVVEEGAVRWLAAAEKTRGVAGAC